MRSAVLPEERGRHCEFELRLVELGLDRIGTPGRFGQSEMRFHGLGTGRTEQVLELAPLKLFLWPAGELARRRVGLENATVRGIDHQHGFGRDLEQQPITCFRVAKARILALHRLLGIDELLLKRGDAAKISPDSDHAARVSNLDSRIAHRHGDAALRRMVHLTPPRHATAARRFLEQFLDLGAAIAGNRIDPALADPGAITSRDRSSVPNAISRTKPLASMTTAISDAAEISFDASSASRSPSVRFGALNCSTVLSVARISM